MTVPIIDIEFLLVAESPAAQVDLQVENEKFRADFLIKSSVMDLAWKERDSVDGQGGNDWFFLWVGLLREGQCQLVCETDVS